MTLRFSATLDVPMEQLQIPGGTYIIGVSGGVDSVVLLDLAAQAKNVALTVAHFDHGIRPDSKADAELVRVLAKKYGLPFVLGSARLGKDASEEMARIARYSFLHQCRKKYNAQALLLAHHQDDITETVILNLIRGTGWRGLSSLRSTAQVVRPMLALTKADILAYANEHQLVWREDDTNADGRYLRNHIRLHILPSMLQKDPAAASKLLALYGRQLKLIEPISRELAEYLSAHVALTPRDATLSRYELIMLPEQVALEILQASIAYLIQEHVLAEQAKRLLLFAKTARPGKTLEVAGDIKAWTNKSQLSVEAAPDMVS